MVTDNKKSIYEVLMGFNRGEYPSPNEIKLMGVASDPLAGRFGKCEVEMAAGKLLSFLQHRNKGWEEFTISDLFAYYKSKGWNPDMMFFGLLGPWFDDGMSTMDFRDTANVYLVVGDNGKYYFTDKFVTNSMRK